jgi:hypothetical protein
MTATLSRPRTRLRVEPLEDRLTPATNVVIEWNELLMQSLPASSRVPNARNMALVHVAMFDAVNAIDRTYEPYHARVHASRGASQEAAVAQAARDTLVALFPARQAIYDAALAEDLAGIAPGRARQGIAIGQEVARQILELRAADGSGDVETYTPPNDDPGQWHPTAPDFSPAGAVHVSSVTPFATESSSQFRPGPPPGLNTNEYATAFNETKSLGRATGSDRTEDQTLVAGLWRTALGNHQVWNRIAQDEAEDRGASLVEDARLFALLNMSLHDGLQTSFGTKFHYALWRPVEAIARAAEDGNPLTVADPDWSTLHPTTPPYPTYSGNAATIGAACATVLSGLFGDDVEFQVDWGNYGFPGVTRTYENFWDAAFEQADSRIYGGIHFRFDSVAGQQIGAGVGGYVMAHFLRPDDSGPTVGMVNGELIVFGSAAEVLHVDHFGGSLTRGANDTQLGTFATSVTGIVVDARPGNDHVLPSPRINTNAEQDDGTGADRLRDGGGNDLLYGGPGDDWLFGGPEVDFLDGGDGDNHLVP